MAAGADADEGIRKVEQYAAWLEREWPAAAASLREGLAELFTVNRLGLPAALRRCGRSSAHRESTFIMVATQRSSYQRVWGSSPAERM